MYKCHFCQFSWTERYKYGDKTERPEDEKEGRICPRCLVIQKDVTDEDRWKVTFRKFAYGKHLTKDEMLKFEDFLMANFTPK